MKNIREKSVNIAKKIKNTGILQKKIKCD